MTPTSFYESIYGPHCHSLPKTAIVDIMEKFADHKHEEWKLRKNQFNTEQFTNNMEERRNKDGNKIQELP